MSRESKILRADALNLPPEEIIRHYESFGWELLSLNGNQLTMSRETQNPVYTDLVKFQYLYEQKITELNAMRPPMPPAKPRPVSAGICIVSFLCLIVPCVIYGAYKFTEYNAYREKLKEYQDAANRFSARQSALCSEIEQILQNSRATFFGKKN